MQQFPTASPGERPAQRKGSRAHLINLLFFGIGVLTLGWLMHRVGVNQLASQLVGVGGAFWAILLIELCSNAASCRGWHYTFRPNDRPSYGRLLLTGIASLSVGGALPSGQAGELAKANLLRGHVAGPEIVSSLLLFNYLHMLTNSALVVACALFGLACGLFPWRVGALVAAVGLVLVLFTAGFGALLQSRVMERVVRAARSQRVKWLRPPERWLGTASAIDTAMRGLARRDLLWAAGWLTVGRLFQVGEVYVVLAALGIGDSAPEVAMVYAITAVANYLLMVLPAREGFLEGSSYLAFGLLGMAQASGLSFELVRRLRKIVYQVIGLVLMLGLTAHGRWYPPSLRAHGCEGETGRG